MGPIDLPGADDMLRQAQAQAEAHQMLQNVLRAALQSPHEVRELRVSMIALADEDGKKTLLIATPTGERIDVPLSETMARGLLRGLMESDGAEQSEAA